MVKDMSNEEAIMIIQAIPNKIWEQLDKCESEAMDMAFKSLEKRIPKKPQQTKDGSFACECGLVVRVKNKTNCLYYCHSCGQKIDWSK